MKKYFPFLDWIKHYKKEDFSGDLSAGLTVGVMLIPQGMAYSMLAGLPPIYGLYASTIPVIIYAFWGTSRQLVVGPVAMVSLLVFSGVSALATAGSDEFITLAILLALMVGTIQFLMGVFRLGFIVNFLSHPVITGFTSAIAIIIGFIQLKHLLGIDIPRGKVHEIIMNVIQNFDAINFPTLVLGSISIGVLLFIKRLKKRIPGPLIAVLLGIGAVHFFQLTTLGVKVVGDIPSGLPVFSLPSINFDNIKLLLPTALAISFVSFMQSVAVAKAIQKKHKNYEIRNNQELIGLGLANILGSFFKAFPVTGGFSRTAVNDQAGAKTGLAGIISASLIVLTLLFFTSYFYYLPTAILSAIIMVAVIGLIDIKEAKYLWETDKRDFVLFMITAIGTLFWGIEEGILLGAGLSLIAVIYNISYPHIAILGKIKEGNIYRNIERFEDVETIDDTFIIRFDARLYFANINYFKDFVWKQINDVPQLKHLVLDASTINGMDSSAIHTLKDMIEDLKQRNIAFYLVNVRGPVRDKLKQTDLFEKVGKDHILNNIQEAVTIIQFNQKPSEAVRRYATQTDA